MEQSIALVASIAALLGTLLGVLLNTWRFRSERHQWRSEFDRETNRWRTEYGDERRRWLTELRAKQDEQQIRLLEKTLDRRFASYGAVLSLLGRVRDYDSPDGSHFRELQETRGQMADISNGLLCHLYGDAGLAMEMDTRNALVEAIQTAESFRLGRASLEDLCESFFMARRFLRSDLQICDHPTIKGQLERIQEDFRSLLEERRKQFEGASGAPVADRRILASTGRPASPSAR
jgi:hypothetical protein